MVLVRILLGLIVCRLRHGMGASGRVIESKSHGSVVVCGGDDRGTVAADEWLIAAFAEAVAGGVGQVAPILRSPR